MHQNPQKNEAIPPQKGNDRARRRKKIRQAFNFGNFDHKIMLATFKRYYNWKEKRHINIPFQQLKQDEKQPIFSIALHCGTKNGRNEVLHEYVNQFRHEDDVRNKTINNFQKILNSRTNSRSCDDSKRLTFIDFKTKRNQKDNFFSYPDVKNIQFTEKIPSKRANTQIRAKTTSFRKTGFPRQLTNLKEMIKKLPSVKEINQQSSQIPTEPNYQLTNPTLFNNSYLSNKGDFNEAFMQSQLEQCSQSPKLIKKIFRKSKTQSIRGYIQELNEVISYADELMHESTEVDSEDNGFQFTAKKAIVHKKISPQHATNHRKYWPQYPRYSLRDQIKYQDQQFAKFFTNFSYADPKLNIELQNIVNSIKKDLNYQEKKMNKEIAQSQKNSIEHRFKYKMGIEKDNYKRNVKSFLKCKKEYRIQRRREQVRANGITRLKKSNNTDKMIKVAQKQVEEG